MTKFLERDDTPDELRREIGAAMVLYSEAFVVDDQSKAISQIMKRNKIGLFTDDGEQK